jgi:hypothetical protein
VAIKLGQITSKSVRNTKKEKDIEIEENIKNKLFFNFEKGQTYYLQLNLSSSNSDEIKVVLSNGKFEMPVRIIPNFSTGVYDFIFTPDRDYTYISFTSANVDNSSSIIFQQLNNIFLNYTNIKDIGLQGFPGLRFSINGESFTLGKSGFFYLSDINITQMGVYLRENIENTEDVVNKNKDFFIISFQYEDKGGS